MGRLSSAAHGQVHHSDSGHFRRNYQFHLIIKFPQLPKLFLWEKARRRRMGGVLGWGQSPPGEKPPPYLQILVKCLPVALELTDELR